MFINTSLLERFQNLRDVRNYQLSQGNDVDYLKPIKAGLWADVRNTYHIPADVKLKVELDGTLAGELRYKDSGAVYAPTTDAVCSACPPTPPQQQDVRIDGEPHTGLSEALNKLSEILAFKPTDMSKVDKDRLVVISSDGLAVVCSSVEQINYALGDMMDSAQMFRVAV